MFEKIALITGNRNKKADAILERVANYLISRKKTLILNKHCAGALEPVIKQPATENDDIGKDCDLAIAIGGDGTMLMASKLLWQYHTLLLGINLGKIGFLSDIPAHSITTALDQILAGEYLEDKRLLLHGELWREDKKIITTCALNDIVIQKWNIARMISLDTYINNAFVHTQRADGMIVATPTGSTAYALSGGGPILEPSLDMLMLTPVCPHMLSNRPIIIDGNSNIEIIVSIGEPHQACLVTDGEIQISLQTNDKVLIRKKTEHTFRFIHLPNHDQFKILREKLHWGK